MGDIFHMPFKIAVILESMRLLTAMYEGIDSGANEHRAIMAAFVELQAKLMIEIDKVPME